MSETFIYYSTKAIEICGVLVIIGGALLAWLIGRALGWYEAGQGAGLIASVLGALLIIFIVSKLPSKV